MKRFILPLFAAFFVLSAAAQVRPISDGKRMLYPQLCPPSAGPEGTINNQALQPGEKPAAITVIGNTWYDTQTYNWGNLMNRIYQYSDGTIGATWMHKAASVPPDRGTAYNYFDGTTWTGASLHLGGDPNNAFPSYAPWGPNGEIVAHYQYISGEGPIKLLRRETKGTGAWQESVLNPPEGYSLVWHSMITSGPDHEYVHVLAYVYDGEYQGQTSALLYYRSPDGGVTWDINGEIIDGLGSTYFPSIASLHYSWAQPVGNTIAFTYGFDQFDGLVFKSTDNGTTWEKIVVYQSPYSPFGLPDQTTAFGCGDGTSAIALDSQGKVHVAFGRMVRVYDVITTPPGGWYFYSATDGLIYWNETMPPVDSTTVSSYTLDYLVAGGYLVGKVIPDTTIEIPTGQPNYGVGLTSGPQFGLDGSDNLYLVWSALSPRNFSGDFYFRHLYINASLDGGATWTGIKDLTNDFYFTYSECVFPALAPLVEDKIHVVFQEDFTPGTGSGEENFIDHIDFPKELFVGTPAPAGTPGFIVSQCQPNPARENTRILINLDSPADVKITISNSLGQNLKIIDLGSTGSGATPVTVNLSGLSVGIYCLTVHAGGEKIARKVVVE
ncbi:MAG: T9SS type A sorting domain-containing protein [bacterium]